MSSLLDVPQRPRSGARSSRRLRQPADSRIGGGVAEYNELSHLIARRFRVLGEPMRIRILDRLRDGEATDGELSAALSASQQNVSKHLAALGDVGMLGRRKARNHAYYRIVDEGVLALCYVAAA
jgi:DNA-binding transcriptional ArsR family regulator